VILAILDDLLFTSKIRAAASQQHAELRIARSSAAALAEMRQSRPALVILDLDNPRTDPLGLVAAMKSDPALSAVETVGFVSHVRTDLIEAARRAGVTEILPRSAFASQLAQILANYSGGASAEHPR
jgi:PleD family two-component response regulator